MIVYHGSFTQIESPSVNFSKRNLDFGRGFYVTTYAEQADEWAKRKTVRQSGRATVSSYELDEDFTNYNKKVFGEDEEWVEFVCACRRGGDLYKEYDIIFGGVANDKIYRVVDMYYKGLWDMERTLREMKFHAINDQICLINQALIDANLRFVDSYEVSP